MKQLLGTKETTMIQTIDAPTTTIDARYGGRSGFIYASDGRTSGRCFWSIEIAGREATLRPSNVNSTIPPAAKAACDAALRDYLAAWCEQQRKAA
jgi:hypothetical protein